MLSEKKVMILLPQKNFWESDLEPVLEFLEKNEVQLFFSTPENERAIGYNRTEIKSDITISEFDVADYDGFVIIGGPGARVDFWHNDVVISKVKEIIESGKPLLSLTMSPVVVAKTGKLRNKKATVFPEYMALEFFKDFDVIYEKTDILEFENVITTSKTEASDQAVHLLAEKLK